uniref:Thioredoxin domain-containing protein n=1 Tax=Emiliania huxleyi TaxID=2903 RepID=A0A7S3X2V3_EMIHU|mmetsp:Transcript_2561/g.8414  ORF Transcript_2561/g.8414 Transcript_2561/m.8414 type:complete len:286 (-) Transcript_2561:52-909(-)
MANFLNPNAGGQGRSGQARDMLRGMANPSSVGGGEPSGKSDMDRLNDAAMKITQNAAERNLRADMEAEAAEAAAAEEARRIASHREIEVEEEVAEGDDDEWDDDDEMQSLQEKRLAALKARFNAEKQHAAQGHGEYREIGEEDFLTEVCGSLNVVVHFSHPEFFRCRVVDKHLRLLAPKYRGTKFLHLNAEKAPFFVRKLALTVLPAVLVFKDGVKGEQLFGFEDLGGKDDFRTEVLEHWLGMAGAIKMKAKQVARFRQRYADGARATPLSDDDDSGASSDEGGR